MMMFLSLFGLTYPGLWGGLDGCGLLVPLLASMAKQQTNGLKVLSYDQIWSKSNVCAIIEKYTIIFSGACHLQQQLNEISKW